MAEDHQKVSWECPSNKTNNKGPKLWGQLAAQWNLGDIRVDSGMSIGYMGQLVTWVTSKPVYNS